MELGTICLTLFVIAMVIGVVRLAYEKMTHTWLEMRIKDELAQVTRNTEREMKLQLLEEAQDSNRLYREIKQQRKRQGRLEKAKRER